MEVGSVVQLKSGGPLMTVVEGPLSGIDFIVGSHWKCMWFSGRIERNEIVNVSINCEEMYGNAHTGIFPEKALSLK